MQILDIPAGSTILAPTYLHASIRLQLLQSRNALANIQIQSLETYFTSSFEDVFFQYYALLKEHNNEYHYHNKNIQNVAFIKEIATCITHLKEYAIDPMTLPEDNPFLKELKDMVTLLYNVETTLDHINQQCTTMIDASHLYIFDKNASVFKTSLYQQLVSKGATYLEETLKQPNKQFFYALNKRQEIEACAQTIIEQNIPVEDIQLTLLDTSYLPYVQMIFKRYGLPYHALQQQEISPVLSKYEALLAFYLEVNTQTSCALLLQHVFSHTYTKECIDYMQLYDLDVLHFHKIQDQLDLFSIHQKEQAYLYELQEKACDVQKSILAPLQSLLTQQGIDVLYSIDTLLCEHHTFSNKEERKTLFMIRSYYQQIKNCLTSKDDLRCFLSFIHTLSTPSSDSLTGICIDTLQAMSLARPYHFVLGATQKNYPNFTALQGMFDERYFSSLQYPSQEERYHFHEKQVTRNVSLSDTLIVSYCVSTIDGKTQEAALEMELLLDQKAKPYSLKQMYNPYYRNYGISEEEAKQIFTKNHTIYGSISSIERYVNCPYAYFLRYGLQLYEPIDVSFNVAKAGSLAHAILEIITKKYDKMYAQTKQEEIEQLVHATIQEYCHLYPNQKAYFMQHTPRIVEYIMKNLLVLQDHELHSSLVPYASEYHFTYTYPIDQSYQLTLQGIIDRIDASEHHFSILDFKSSSKTLSEKEVFNATTLQLVTYTCIMEEILHKRPIGCFYYSLANPNMNMYYAKLKKRPLSFYYVDEAAMEEEMIKNKKRKGWVMHEAISLYDDNGSHTSQVSQLKDGSINARTIYHPQVLKHHVATMYQKIAQAMLAGNIACEASEHACLYCPYASICKKENSIYEKPPLVEIDESLYSKGGKKNA